MKKIMLALAVAVLAVAANAASFKWAAANIYGSDMTTKYTGEATLYYAVAGSDSFAELGTANVNAGALTYTSTSDLLVGGTKYDLYFTIEDGGKVFTSAVMADKLAQATSTPTVTFGNMASATQNAANWATAAVPEPTSSLLLLLGVAGLALRRKQK